MRITDVLARRQWIEERLDSFQQILEFEYPLGNEVYRDENASVYVVPVLERVDVADMARELIGRRVRETDDLVPAVACMGAESAAHQLPINAVLRGVQQGGMDSPARLEGLWPAGVHAVVCPVCKLRPRADKGTGEERSLCAICLQRRRELRRSRDWVSGEVDGTIWIEEACDENGICALLAGELNLDGWLEPDGEKNYFRLLTLGAQGTKKEPVFVRLQAAWEATHAFWESLQGSLVEVMEKSPWRYRVGGSLSHTPRHANVYETEIGPLSLVWDKETRSFLTASNEKLVLRVLESDAKFLSDVIRARSKLELRTPVGYARERVGDYEKLDEGEGFERFTLEVKECHPEQRYAPVIPIVSEPRLFLAILPAREALPAVRNTVEHYRQHFGKVEGLLPLSLAVVFFDRRSPIYAVMQAARKMLGMGSPEVLARVLPEQREWGMLRLAIQGQDGACGVFAVRRDNDLAYCRLPSGGVSRAVGELQEDESVTVRLSRIDFTHLETAGVRYRLAYDRHTGRRLDPVYPTRPFPLDALTEIEAFWQKLFTGLGSSQINEIFTAVETKRQDWALSYPINDATFREFVAALLRQAEWERGKEPSHDQIITLVEQICSGLLVDAIQLHLKILKERREKETTVP